ncbi:MAG: phosphoglucosamine mutase [Bradymonadia bacterium]
MTKRLYFGTDGVRGRANAEPMTAEFALRLGKAIGAFLNERGRRKPRVLIGKDTRISGYMFETALSSGLVSTGADVLLVGPLPTPAIAFLTSGMRCDVGVVISASHNPFEDNGIKLFDENGFKFPDAVELKLESLIADENLSRYNVFGEHIGKAFRIDDALGRYSVFAKSAFPRGKTLEGLRIVIDCANGAGYRVAPEVLTELGAEVVAVNVHPDGVNINRDSGALSPKRMSERVLRERADVGLALDGDADRCILCDHTGQIVDGDQTLAILVGGLLESNALPNRSVVATVMSNIGLERYLKEQGCNLLRTKVGDRYVVERMRAETHPLGGEQSGHIVQFQHSTTGDGLMAGLSVLGRMVEKGESLHDLASVMKKYPQRLRNIRVSEKRPFEEMKSVQTAIRDVEAELKDEGRVLVRYSGTEKLARVMVEGPTLDSVDLACERIRTAIQMEIGDE